MSCPSQNEAFYLTKDVNNGFNLCINVYQCLPFNVIKEIYLEKSDRINYSKTLVTLFVVTPTDTASSCGTSDFTMNLVQCNYIQAQIIVEKYSSKLFSYKPDLMLRYTF